MGRRFANFFLLSQNDITIIPLTKFDINWNYRLEILSDGGGVGVI